MLDDALVTRLQRHWEEGWNAYDLDVIMEPMGADVVFTSPFVAKLTGDSGTTSIVGYAALQSYIADSLRRVPGIRYTLETTYVSTDSVVLAYTFELPDGSKKIGADSMRVADGAVVDWKSHYPFAAEEVYDFIHE
jgi:hypothetical protein